MHYHRAYRHGDPHKVATTIRTSNGRRYRTAYRPAHPLASKHGVVYVHRMVLFDTIGPGSHDCHWCGKDLDWLPKGDERAIHVDHLNNVGDDNRPENLVPSCAYCNQTRGAQRRHDELTARGWWAANDTVAITHPRVKRIA
jgi:hypothetical protein